MISIPPLAFFGVSGSSTSSFPVFGIPSGIFWGVKVLSQTSRGLSGIGLTQLLLSALSPSTICLECQSPTCLLWNGTLPVPLMTAKHLLELGLFTGGVAYVLCVMVLDGTIQTFHSDIFVHTRTQKHTCKNTSTIKQCMMPHGCAL